MVSQELLERVADAVRTHCRGRGYVPAPWLNPLVPHDSVAAWTMARRLTAEERFDDYVAVAPEGHVYGFFFEKFGASVLSVFVDYPPKHFAAVDDLARIRDRRVLILEDDVLSGVTLALVVRGLQAYGPRALALYLGREKDYQQLQNVPPAVSPIYLAEDYLEPSLRERAEADFAAFFR